MESRDFGAVLNGVQTLFRVGTVAALSDDYLVDSFLSGCEAAAEVAFEALVRRHGPMVLRVCRGELRDVHAAEDAFQATFLILARRAGSIRNRGSVASWLFGVARRVSKRSKVDRARRAEFERRSAVIDAKHGSAGDRQQTDLVPEIHEEVDKLPEKYRSPVILCYLEGLTHEEAASQLRVPVGTVKVRLSRARERLRGRLVRRGLAPIVLAATVTGKASGAIPTLLMNQTIKAALQVAVGRAIGVSVAVASLVDGVLRTMHFAKVKTFAALMATSMTAILASLLIVSYSPRPARSDQPAKVLQVPVRKSAAPAVAVETLKKSNFKRTTTLGGSVQAAESAEVYPRASGFIKNVTVDIGDAVRRGQLLAEIVDPELELGVQKGLALVEQAKTRVMKARSLIRVAESAVRVQQAKVAESEAGLAQSEPLILLRQKEYDRIAELSRAKQVESRLVDEERHRLETAKSAGEVAKAQISLARAGLDESRAKLEAARAEAGEVEADLLLAQTELDRAKIRASYSRVEAPFDGIVTRRGCNRGEFVRSSTEGGLVPMFSVVGAKKMKVVVQVPDADVPFLANGDPVDVWMGAQTDRKYAGVIARTAFAEDPATGTLRAEIDIDNSDGRLRPGQTGGVTISLRARENVLTIPVTALFEGSPGRDGACYGVVDGRAVKIFVATSEVQGDRVEVTFGLSEGDTVVVQPRVSGISDGQIIKLEKRAQKTNN